MKYKALVLNLDGTHLIAKKTKDLLLKIQELGVKLILASRRPTNGLIKISQELDLKKYGGFILTYNGGQIYNMKNESLIVNSSIDKKMILELYDLSREIHTNFITYTDQYIYTEDADDYIELESQANAMPVVKVPNFKNEVMEKSVKCVMTGDPVHLDKLEKKLINRYTGKCSVSRSLPSFIEFKSHGVNKGSGLKQLLKYMDIKKEEVIACCDDSNDIPLIENVGFGVAMKNGCELIKEKAKYIAPSNDEDQIAHVITKFIIREEV